MASLLRVCPNNPWKARWHMVSLHRQAQEALLIQHDPVAQFPRQVEYGGALAVGQPTAEEQQHRSEGVGEGLAGVVRRDSNAAV